MKKQGRAGKTRKAKRALRGARNSFRLRAQAALFDGIIFLMLVVFSVGIVFTALNSYTIAQDKTIRSAYLVNYMYSTSKALYYLDAQTLSKVKGYCDDLGAGTAAYYCNHKEEYDVDCSGLAEYKGSSTVVDLLKKDVSDPYNAENYGGAPAGPKLDDKFGDAQQLGRTGMRCAMKELMKPFTFSGYRYFTEITRAPEGSERLENPIYPPFGDVHYISDVMFTQDFQEVILPGAGPEDDTRYGCDSIITDQLLVVRTPFKVLLGKGNGQLGLNDDGDIGEGYAEAPAGNYVLRTCLWPSSSTR